MLFEFLLDFIYPDRCVICNRWEVDLCRSCFGKLRFNLRRNRNLTAIWDYKDNRVRKVIERIKFGFDRRLIGLLFEFL